MADTFASLAGKLDALANGLRDPGLRGAMTRVGEAAQKDADAAARADLGGDPAFSGWPRVTLSTELKHPAEGQVQLQPPGKARGPWRVAESGRNADGQAALRTTRSGTLQRRSGTRVRKTDGARVDKWRRTKWNGTTAGKGTWSDAEAVIERETPKRVDDEIKRAIRDAGLG